MTLHAAKVAGPIDLVHRIYCSERVLDRDVEQSPRIGKAHRRPSLDEPGTEMYVSTITDFRRNY
jgi:hypothetical protein